MASFNSENQQMGNGVEYNVDGEMLTEVEVDENPPEDDEESIWTDDGGDDMEENMEEAEAQGIYVHGCNIFRASLILKHLMWIAGKLPNKNLFTTVLHVNYS
jgi:hypothetical protein